MPIVTVRAHETPDAWVDLDFNDGINQIIAARSRNPLGLALKLRLEVDGKREFDRPLPSGAKNIDLPANAKALRFESEKLGVKDEDAEVDTRPDNPNFKPWRIAVETGD